MTVVRDVAVFMGGAVVVLAAAYAFCRWLFGDLRLLP